MKRTHRGFTLVELLIVVAIVGVLGAMMTMSSTDAVDAAGANTILENLQSLKTAAYQMYINSSLGVAKTITFAGTEQVGANTTDTTKAVLAGYLGKKSDAIGGSNKYGVVGDKTGWYAVYKIDTTDSAGVKAKLKASAAKVELYGVKKTGDPAIGDFATLLYYGKDAEGKDTDDHTCIALKVR